MTLRPFFIFGSASSSGDQGSSSGLGAFQRNLARLTRLPALPAAVRSAGSSQETGRKRVFGPHAPALTLIHSVGRPQITMLAHSCGAPTDAGEVGGSETCETRAIRTHDSPFQFLLCFTPQSNEHMTSNLLGVDTGISARHTLAHMHTRDNKHVSVWATCAGFRGSHT